MKQQAGQDRDGKITESSELARMLLDLDDLPKPLIGRVQGNAFGGGIGMMAVCDIIIADEGAKFALTETKLGLIPATISPYVVRRMGEGKARTVFMNGKIFNAQKAFQLGLVSEIASNNIDDLIDLEIGAFLQCAPGAVRDAKVLCLQVARNQNDDLLMWTANKLADRWETIEAKEGIQCFFDKKTASWVKK
jgi:methylglutaconyl-CoA hydratase